MFRMHPQTFEAPVYRAWVEEVVDGDTLYVWIDLGFFEVGWQAIRVKGVDTPEIFAPADEEELRQGRAAKMFVEDLVLGEPVRLRTSRIRGQKEKAGLGRFEAKVEYRDENREWADLAQAIRDAGFDTLEDDSG